MPGSSLVLIPFVIAFLIFVLRFYTRESASSITNASFLLAILCVLLAGAYLGLGVVSSLPGFGPVAFGVVGIALLGVAILRMFQL